MTIRPFRKFSLPLAAATALTGVALLLGAPMARAADLEVEVSGVTAVSAEKLAEKNADKASDKSGQVLVAVYVGADVWLRKPTAVGRASLSELKDGVVKLRLSGLPDGPVAISVFQDLNGNGKLDSNMMGMPTEPYAFSRQAQGNFGPPSFDQAALPAGTTRHAIRLPAQP